MTTGSDSTTSVASWVIGIVLCNIASLGEGIAILTVRKSWKVADSSKNHHVNTSTTKESFFKKTKKWTYLRYAAIFWMIAINPIMKIVALALTSPSIVAPFSGVVLAWVILLQGRIVGDETTGWNRIGAALLIMLGGLLVSLYGDHNSHNDDDGANSEVVLGNMVNAYRDPLFQAYLVIAATIQGVLLLVICFANNDDENNNQKNTRHWKRYAWGISAGFLLGAFANFAKDTITILQATQQQPGGSEIPIYSYYYFWLFLLIAGCVALGSLVLRILCTKRYDAVFTAGSSAASYSLMASLMSAIHYDTFSHLDSTTSQVLYPIGLTSLLVGACSLVHWSDESGGGSSSSSSSGGEEKMLPEQEKMMDGAGTSTTSRMQQQQGDGGVNNTKEII